MDSETPYIAKSSVVYIVRHPRPVEVGRDDSYCFYIEVDDYDYAHIQGHSHLKGRAVKNMDFLEKMEAYSFLIELEILEWKNIGPEDRELFVTDEFNRRVSSLTTQQS